MFNEEKEINEKNIWIGTWASAQYAIAADNPNAASVVPPLSGASFRQFIRVSLGGEKLRLSYSNEYGEGPLEIKAVHIAKPLINGSSNIDRSTDTALSFKGSESIVIPPGEKAISDEIDYQVKALDKIAITTYFGKTPNMMTHHAASRSNSFLRKGNAVSDEIINDAVHVCWYFLCNVDVYAPSNCRSIICFGDSITDGYGTEQVAFGNKPDSYLRWVDVLMEKINSSPVPKPLSVVNMGIGGNAIFGGQGPAARERFDRDVIKQPGAGYLLFMIGVNDILRVSNANAAMADLMINELKIMIEKSKAKGIKVLAGTITPLYGNGTHTTVKEGIRKKVNALLRSNEGDGNYTLVDFDKHLSDNDMYLPRYKHIYNRDGTHPNIAGYKAMGELAYSVIDQLNLST